MNSSSAGGGAERAPSGPNSSRGPLVFQSSRVLRAKMICCEENEINQPILALGREVPELWVARDARRYALLDIGWKRFPSCF